MIVIKSGSKNKTVIACVIIFPLHVKIVKKSQLACGWPTRIPMYYCPAPVYPYIVCDRSEHFRRGLKNPWNEKCAHLQIIGFFWKHLSGWIEWLTRCSLRCAVLRMDNVYLEYIIRTAFDVSYPVCYGHDQYVLSEWMSSDTDSGKYILGSDVVRIDAGKLAHLRRTWVSHFTLWPA